MNHQTPDNEKICPRCGKATHGTSGSITQWISGCKCAELSDLQYRTPKTCATCGKKIESGRPGSLTQWVFRQDICSCSIGGADFPGQFQNQDSSVDFGAELDPAGDTTIPDEEITVDGDRFPLKRYAPLAELGKGAAGTVYLCRDRLLGAKVAVKCLNNLTSQQLLSFHQEARAMFKLSHPNIVKVINFDVTESGSPYLVMEYFPSVSLADLISERGGLNWNELYGIIVQITEGLAYAHNNGVFHRDLKPSNILLQHSGSTPRIRIIDFGVALVKNVTDGRAIDQGKTLVGTPEYMSPDQAAGIAYDARSEIYSLGCLAFEAATGRPPFDATGSLELINQHANAEPPLLDDLSENEFPQQFHYLIARMLEKDPDSRPQSMENLRQSLISIEQSQTGISTYESKTENAGGDRGALVGKRPKIGKLQIFGIALLSLAGLLLLVLHDKTNSVPNTVTEPKKRNNTGKVLEKFVLVGNEFDEPGKWKRLLTAASFHEPVTDEDLQYVSQVMGAGCQGIDLSSFKGVKGKGIKYLRNLEIQCINASGVVLTPAGWKYLSEIKSLEEVVFEKSNIADADLKHFENHPSIWAVSLAGCPDITDDGVRSVATIRHLSKLDLSYTKVTSGLKALGGSPELGRIYLEGTQISDQDLMGMTPAPLFDVRFAHCPNITGKSLKFIAATWPTVRGLEFGGNTAIKPEDLEFLRPLNQLSHLNIAGVVGTDEGMEIIGNKTKLQELLISNGRFPDKSLKHLYELKHLRLLNLIGCKHVTRESIETLKRHFQTKCNVIFPGGADDSTLPLQFKDVYELESELRKPEPF